MSIDTKFNVSKKLLKNKNDFCLNKLSKMNVKISFLYIGQGDLFLELVDF
jgi:hypothetical protein